VTSTINYAIDALDQSSGLDMINSAEAQTLDEVFPLLGQKWQHKLSVGRSRLEGQA